MKKVLLSMTALWMLAGCVTAPVPENYSGPLSKIQDSYIAETSSRASFYYLSEVNGKRVDNTLLETRRANNGRGFGMIPMHFERNIPSSQVTLKLEATVEYGAPIQQLLNGKTLYSAEKTISFVPQPDRSYVVKGVLTGSRKEVWLEEAETGKRVE